MHTSVETGTIETIHLVAEEGGPPESVERATAVAAMGLEGDRKVLAARAGGEPAVATNAQLTLITAEAIEQAAESIGTSIPPGATRRNIVVRGLDVDRCVGRLLRVGGARVRGVEPCDPCGYLERTSGLPGITRALVDRGGLRCEVLDGGPIAVGDEVLVVDEPPAPSA